MAKKYILEDVPNEVLDQILSLQPKAKNHYFSKLGKEFYPNLVEDSDEYVELVESYVSSFYVEKLYRTNRFFNERFTPVYTDTGLIRNIIADLFYADDDLITH
jgi:hypothetical protein|tara:strand:- start:366 stop:674 length:309 start_codon:yes stop_codon:yes gene_type:complete